MANSNFHSLQQHNTSTLAKLDARIKIILSLCLALTITLLTSLPLLTLLFIITTLLLFAAGTKLSYILKRSVPLLPFIVPIVFLLPLLIPGETLFNLGPFKYSLEGIKLGTVILLRMLSIVFIFTGLVSSTPQDCLLFGVRKLGIPLVFIQIIQFALRYIEVLAIEAKTMLTAMQSRAYQKQIFFNLTEVKYLGSLIGMLFIRSYSRAERIYLAMLSRGYSSDIIINEQRPVAKTELILSTGIMFICMIIVFVDRGGLINWM